MSFVRWAMAVMMAFAAWTWAGSASAWLFHEHTHIGRTAVQLFQKPVNVSAEARRGVTDVELEALSRLKTAWKSVLRSEQEERSKQPKDDSRRAKLCDDFSMPEAVFLFQNEDERHECIDFPMLVALAGDFSCSPEDLWNVAIGSTWVPNILDQAESTESALKRPRVTLAQKIDAWRNDNIENFIRDEQYLSRASDNRSHFAWPRRTERLGEYLRNALKPGQKPSSYAFYILYHGAALRLARRASSAGATTPRWDTLRRALLSEAFALHYLEDSFSAGHIAGRRGGSRVRNGTHDYYCENGLDGRVWSEDFTSMCEEREECELAGSYYAHGDAFMTTTDRLHAAVAVQRSLHDLAHALRWDVSERTWLFDPSLDYIESTDGLRMDACKGIDAVPAGLVAAADDRDLRYTLGAVIQPARAAEGTPLEEDQEPITMLPVFATEMGVFGGVFASARVVGGFDVQGSTEQWQLLGKMDVGFEGGVGLAGATTAESDGLLWLQAGAAIDSPGVYGSRYDAHPGRFGGALRLRAPFYAVPLLEHLFYTLPAWFSDELKARAYLTKGAVAGMFGAARVMTFSQGSMQLVLGREFGFRYVMGPNAVNNAFGFEWPILEYKPLQWYAGSVGNVFTAQLGASLDVENSRTGVLGLFLRLGVSVRKYRYP